MCRYNIGLLAIMSFLLYTMSQKILVQFGKKVRAERRKQSLSQEKLAEKSGLHRNYIGAVERGEKNISLINIEKIAKALQIETSDFFKPD